MIIFSLTKMNSDSASPMFPVKECQLHCSCRIFRLTSGLCLPMIFPLDALIEKLNERVLHSANGEKFITLFVGKFNYKTRELQYINAGHNQPMMYLKTKKELSFLEQGLCRHWHDR